MRNGFAGRQGSMENRQAIEDDTADSGGGEADGDERARCLSCRAAGLAAAKA